jgi:hypothetical protein
MFKLKFNHVTKYYNSKIKQMSTTKVTTPIAKQPTPITKQPKAHNKGNKAHN